MQPTARVIMSAPRLMPAVGPTKAKDGNREEKSIVSRTIGGTIRSKCLQQILATG
jgi:hypothetical protein